MPSVEVTEATHQPQLPSLCLLNPAGSVSFSIAMDRNPNENSASQKLSEIDSTESENKQDDKNELVKKESIQDITIKPTIVTKPSHEKYHIQIKVASDSSELNPLKRRGSILIKNQELSQRPKGSFFSRKKNNETHRVGLAKASNGEYYNADRLYYILLSAMHKLLRNGIDASIEFKMSKNQKLQDFDKASLHLSRSAFSKTSENRSNDKESANSYSFSPEELMKDYSGSDRSSIETLDISELDNSDQTDTEYNDAEDCNRLSYHRNIVAFWLLGVCHKMTYNITLAAVRDILYLYAAVDNRTGRACVMLDWFIVLSEAIPGFLGKFVGLFIPLYPRSRTILVCFMSITGCLLTTMSDYYQTNWMFYTGFGISTFAGTMAEALYLSCTTKYDFSTITAFSSGTGHGSIFAISIYVILRANGFEVGKILVLNLVFIAIESCAFFVIMKPPCKRLVRPGHHNLEPHEPLDTPLKKIRFIPHVLPFMLPYTVQNFAQYMITRGTNPLQIYGEGNITPFYQVTCLSIAFFVGNLVTRSFGNLADQRQLWLLACLQVFNCIAMWMEVKYSLLPHFWQAMAFSIWVGLVSGSSYLNTHYLITKQQPSGTRMFSLSFAAFGEQLSLTVALIILRSLFNYMCNTPLYRDLVRILMYHYYG